MSSSKHLEVECLLCKEVITCRQHDTSSLVNHVTFKHPDIKISNLPKEFSTTPKSTSDKYRNNVKRAKVPSTETEAKKPKITGCSLKKIMEKRNLLSDSIDNSIPKYVEISEEKQKLKRHSERAVQKRKLYKTSVEKWRPGDDKILCPKCETMVRPMIRTSADRVSHNPIGAAFLMACWPFCFFPFLFPAPTQEHLHCIICGYYFGTYDYQKEVMDLPKKRISDTTIDDNEIPNKSEKSTRIENLEK